jgi:hypothetical protein
VANGVKASVWVPDIWTMSEQARPTGKWPRPFHLYLFGSVALSVAVLATAWAEYSRSHSWVALLVVVVVAFWWAATTAQVLFVRHLRALSLSGARRAHPTGRTVEPVLSGLPHGSRPLVGGGWSLTGSAVVVGALGMLHAMSPLAVLELSTAGLSVRVRLGRLFGAAPLVVVPGGGAEIFPVKGRRPNSTGLGIRAPRSLPCFFWTRSRDEILTDLAALGYEPSWEEQRPKLW